MLKVVSAMRIPLTMVIIAIAMLASPLALERAENRPGRLWAVAIAA